MENQPSNEKKTNFDYLKESLYYLGFGDKVNASLEGAIKEGKQDIKIVISSLFDRPDSRKDDNLSKDYVNYELTFKKGTETDNYFFNSYSAKLVTPQAEERIQQFYIDKGKGITAKEAYNLLSGRAVQKTFIKKDGEKYQAFLQYDIKSPKDEKGNYQFQKFHENYGYKIDKALDTYPISFETPEKKLELIKSLEKGNAQFVKLTTGQHVFAVADPQYKDIKFLDNQNKNVRVEKMGQTEKPSVSRGRKNKI